MLTENINLNSFDGYLCNYDKIKTTLNCYEYDDDDIDSKIFAAYENMPDVLERKWNWLRNIKEKFASCLGQNFDKIRMYESMDYCLE